MTEIEITQTELIKEERLKALLHSLGRVAVAYSGGVDSTYLADVAHEALGHDLLLILNDSPSNPREELAEARRLAQEKGWPLEVIQSSEFENDAYLANTSERCYVCKGGLFDLMWKVARDHGFNALVHGENADDARDETRTGHRAAQERGVVAPLQAVGLTKDEIRTLSRWRGLPTWDKPSMACLSTRVPTGTRLDIETLLGIEQVEAALKALGFRQHRMRHHGDLCRIELAPADIARAALPEIRRQIVEQAREAGYRYVTLDLSGYGARE